MAGFRNEAEGQLRCPDWPLREVGQYYSCFGQVLRPCATLPSSSTTPRPGPWWPWYRLSRRLPAAAPSAPSRAIAVRCQRVMQVRTGDAGWVVPPQRAVWIPPGVEHEVRMLGVSTRSLYIEPGSATAMPAHCQVLAVSPLLRQLLLAAVDMPLEYDTEGRDGALATLLLHELAAAETLPLRALAARAALAGALRGVPRRARHLRQRRALGRAAAYQPAQFQPHLPSLHRPQLRGLEATRLRGAGTGAAGRRRNGHCHRPGLRLPEPGSLLDHVPPGPGQPPSAFQAGALRSPGGP